ncbi:MAG: hypothetical protein ACI83P_001149 [Janthinobacterium sp.]|jgi:hypothetical protein
MNNFTQLLALTEELAKALASLPLTVKQKGDLGLLFAAENGIPISRDKGSRVRGDTIYSCSKIGSDLTKYFDGIGPQDKMMWIGYCQPIGEIETWVMRPEVTAALRTLGWFQARKSAA